MLSKEDWDLLKMEPTKECVELTNILKSRPFSTEEVIELYRNRGYYVVCSKDSNSNVNKESNFGNQVYPKMPSFYSEKQVPDYFQSH